MNALGTSVLLIVSLMDRERAKAAARSEAAPASERCERESNRVRRRRTPYCGREADPAAVCRACFRG
jgi:hypothetical protein